MRDRLKIVWGFCLPILAVLLDDVAASSSSSDSYPYIRCLNYFQFPMF